MRSRRTGGWEFRAPWLEGSALVAVWRLVMAVCRRKSSCSCSPEADTRINQCGALVIASWQSKSPWSGDLGPPRWNEAGSWPKWFGGRDARQEGLEVISVHYRPGQFMRGGWACGGHGMERAKKPTSKSVKPRRERELLLRGSGAFNFRLSVHLSIDTSTQEWLALVCRESEFSGASKTQPHDC